jgi:hypothetical protein
MLQQIWKITALIALWVANLFLLIGLWQDVFILGVIGIFLGMFFGLPSAYLWFRAEPALLKRLNRIFYAYLKQPGRKRSSATIPAKANGATTSPEAISQQEPMVVYYPTASTPASASDEQSPVITIPVQVLDRETTPETFSNVTKPAPPPPPATLKVPVELLQDEENDDSGRANEEASVPVEPPKPSEWELNKARDAEYKRIRSEIENPETPLEDVLAYQIHADERVRLALVQRLRHTNDENTATYLNQALEDEADVVRRAARIALQEIEEK